eukprot:60277_1
MTTLQKWEACHDSHDLCQIYRSGAITLASIYALTMVTMTGVYIRRTKEYGFLFWVGIVFFTIDICAMIAMIFTASFLHSPHHFDEFAASFNLLGQLYAVQYIVLIGILYARLKVIFDNTPFRLSKRLHKSFMIFYAIAAPTFIFTTVLYQNHLSAISYIASAIVLGIISTVLPGTLITLFIKKLRRVHGYAKGKRDGRFEVTTNDESDTFLVKIITKTSLLAFTSIAISMFTGTVFSCIQFQSDNLHYYALGGDFLCTLDVFSNFLSIWLSYKEADDWYAKICGICDSRCNRAWSKCPVDVVMNADGEVVASRTGSVASGSDSEPDSRSNSKSGKADTAISTDLV